MKPVIFTSFNNDIDPRFYEYQAKIMKKFGLEKIYHPLKYEFHYSIMTHGDVLNKFVNSLFYEHGFDCILIMDIDCIPLSREGIEKVFEYAEDGCLVGNIQRSNHIQNNKHLYAASSFICFTKDLYRQIGRPSFLPSDEGDTCEQLTYNAERFFENPKNCVILLEPGKIDAPIDDQGNYWELDGNMKYGIGTEFLLNDEPVNYHLFASRLHMFNHYFFQKCEDVLSENSSLYNM